MGSQTRPRPADRPGAGDKHVDRGAQQQSAATPAALLLPRLEAARETGPGRWLARCPAHDDRHPSLTLRELDDGTLLLRCWAGCDTGQVVASVSLELADLFPRRSGDRGPLRPGERWVPADVLRAIAHEANIAAIAAADLARGETLSAEDRERLRTASIRLHAAAQNVG